MDTDIICSKQQKWRRDQPILGEGEDLRKGFIKQGDTYAGSWKIKCVLLDRWEGKSNSGIGSCLGKDLTGWSSVASSGNRKELANADLRGGETHKETAWQKTRLKKWGKEGHVTEDFHCSLHHACCLPQVSKNMPLTFSIQVIYLWSSRPCHKTYHYAPAHSNKYSVPFTGVQAAVKVKGRSA